MLQHLLKLLKAIFIVYPQCAKHSHPWRTVVPISFYFEGAGARIGICFLDISTGMAKIFPVALCL